MGKAERGADRPIPGLEYKATTAGAESGLIAADDDTGVVEAIVSVTGVEDDDGDTIEPGAYADTLKKRTPKGIFSHDWKRWSSRTEAIEELMPGDPRLAEYASKMAKPWPAGAGGLYVRTRYNLNTQTGRDAYEDVKFFSATNECEWSIGYRVPKGKAVRAKGGGRRLKAVDLFEYSPVLFGANSMSGTLSVKAAPAEAPEEEDDGPAEDDTPARDVPGDAPGDATDGQGDLFEDVPVTETDDAGGSPDEPDSATGGDPEDEGEADPDSTGDGELAALHQQAARALDWEEIDAAAEDAPDLGEEQAEEKRAFGAGKRREMAKRGKALPDGSFPIENASDLENAIKAFGRAKDKAKAKAHILRHARRLGRMDLIPDDWKTGKDAAADVETKAGTPGTADTPSDAAAVAKLKRWYTHGEGAAKIRWGQPGDFLRCVRIAEKHMTPQQAKGFCNLRHQDALGKAPGQERGNKDAAAPAGLPGLPGTYEELRDELHDVATKALAVDDPYVVEVLGTWPDHAVVTRYTLDGTKDAESFELPFTRPAGGALELGDPVPVEVTVEVDGEASGVDQFLPYPAMIEDVAGAMKALVAAETKAGRVLSQANAGRLKSAVEQLVTVLKVAGIEIGDGADEDSEDRDIAEEAAPQEIDSTAPSARLPEGKAIHPELLARAYSILGDAALQREMQRGRAQS